MRRFRFRLSRGPGPRILLHILPAGRRFGRLKSLFKKRPFSIIRPKNRVKGAYSDVRWTAIPTVEYALRATRRYPKSPAVTIGPLKRRAEWPQRYWNLNLSSFMGAACSWWLCGSPKHCRHYRHFLRRSHRPCERRGELRLGTALRS